MDDKVFWILIVVALFVFLGPLKLSDLRLTDDRYRRGNLRYQTPGRNQRQRQLAQDKAERKEMGQSQSQSQDGTGTSTASAPTETEIVEDPEVVRKRNEEERARRAAAAEARFKKDKSNQEIGKRLLAQKKAQKGKSALEQASEENRGWRAADEMHDVRSYN